MPVHCDGMATRSALGWASALSLSPSDGLFSFFFLSMFTDGALTSITFAPWVSTGYLSLLSLNCSSVMAIASERTKRRPGEDGKERGEKDRSEGKSKKNESKGNGMKRIGW